MPSSPVIQSAPSVDRAAPAVAITGAARPAERTRDAASAQAPFVTAHAIAVARKPANGISTNAAPSAPSTAASVFAAYKVAIEAPRSPASATRRSMAGKVAPIAAIAGSSNRNVPAKIHVHWSKGEGSMGSHATHWVESAGNANARN